jgi:hypothetical protein
MKLPFRLWLDGGIVLALAVLGTWAYFHIEKLGELKVQREVEAAFEAQRKVDTKDIVHTVPRPDPAATVRVCNPVRSSPARQDARPGPGTDAAVRPAPAVAEQGEGRDVTAITESVLIEAGARIAYLQGYIRTCQEQGFCDANSSR